MLVEKKLFELPRYRTMNGDVIESLRVGWGELRHAQPGQIQRHPVTHYFSGTSHAAGRYSLQDELPGYWDAIIGLARQLIQRSTSFYPPTHS